MEVRADWPLAPLPPSAEELAEYRATRLREVIAHARANVPYWRRLFTEHGVAPDDVRGPADLRHLPITDRSTLQALPAAEVVAEGLDPDALSIHRTSGSSGAPLTIRRGWDDERRLRALRLRAAGTFGMRMGDRRGSLVLMRPTPPPSPWERVYPETRIDCLRPAREIVDALRACRPDVVIGFPGVLAQVASVMTQADRAELRPRFLMVGGESLTPDMRERTEAGFGAPVRDTYGCHELSLVAWECVETGAYHVTDDGLVLEVLGPDGEPVAPGERGEVVATSLQAFAMPFVRYRLGDVVTRGAERCACGAPFSTIESIQGRMIDYFPLPGGRLVHPYRIVIELVRGHPWIRQYRLDQEREDRIVAELVVFEPPGPGRLAEVEGAVRGFLGPDVEFEARLVPAIDVEANGKFRVSRSRVRSAYDGVTW